MEAMRKSLESSWDDTVMGVVPTDPESAAEAAAESIEKAFSDNRNVVVVNLGLPSYDITQGVESYDEALAVEFCVSLTSAIEDRGCVRRGGSAILVRDERVRRGIERVLDARERRRSGGERRRKEAAEEEAMEEVSLPAEGKDDDDDDEEDGGDDVDAFRKKLMSTWDASSSPPSSSDDAPKPSAAAAAAAGETPSPSLPRESKRPRTKKATEATNDGPYRLGSLLGDADIPAVGPSKFDAVLKAVSQNAVPDPDAEDVLLILSAQSPEELIAVRSLVAKYGQTKKIVLVNCRLDPKPTELKDAVTAYAVRPFLAMPKGTNAAGAGADQGNNQPQPTPTKIVVLKRYPSDWELYVDPSGGGEKFQLVDEISDARVYGNPSGPDEGWIKSVTAEFMRRRYGR